ncbi:MAG: carbohydrate ABC transporter permease [Clostridiales bacterium]|nr:carbohydrate ABC transporter permease [Clostridiales bacterium]
MALKEKKTVWDVLFEIAIYVFFTFFTLLCIFPFYYIFISSISSNALVDKGAIFFYPRSIHFSNYISVFKIKTLPQAAFISVSRTVIGTALSLIAASFMGYCMSKPEYWHRKFVYRVIIATMYFNAGVVPLYLTYRALGLIDNFLVYVLPCLNQSFNMVLCKTYMESIPGSLEESAEIDGAGYFRRYTRIILPLSMPILATIAIFAAVGQWNAFMDTVLYMTSTKYFTLQYTLNLYLKKATALADILKTDSAAAQNMNLDTLLTAESTRYTITMVTIIPVLMIYPFFQRYFIKGIMIGAVKG